MNTPSFRDVEQLSAYLDGNLSEAETARLEIRLRSEPGLGAVLEDLRQARAALRRTPQRRAPRNFTLTPKMAGLKPPVPRSVPVLSWASAVAMLLFVCSLGTSLLGRLPLGAGAPLMAAAPAGMGGGNANDSGAQENGVGGGPPASTEAPAALEVMPLSTPTAEGFTSQSPQPPPTSETFYSQALEPTPALIERNAANQPLTPKNPRQPVNPWLFIWPGLAAALIGAALLIRWAGARKFRKRVETQK
jgi:hypothetical protein